MSKGFTLIELLLVVVIIGIVAALVLPKFADVKDRAYQAAMQNDLRNLAVAQEIHFEKHGQYSGPNPAAAFSAAELETSGIEGFSTSNNVTIAVSQQSAQGYRAVATHGQISGGTECWLDIGLARNNRVECGAAAPAWE